MIEFIKASYVSAITGVTNTATGWKVTRDRAGLEIIDETPTSENTIDRYYSNIMIPIGEEVYIWYQMRLSNDEIKEWTGPYPYQSRESNISNDLKPLTRIETPYSVMDQESLTSGGNIIKIDSSPFRGDYVDGILSVSWIVKNPEDKIIFFRPEDKTRIDTLELNRSSLGLDRYDYIDVYIKHHGANGSASDFGINRFDLRTYPFKFSGDVSVDITDVYNFIIIPYDSANPGLGKIRIIDAVSNKKVYEITDVSTLSFNIPAYTLEEDREYVIECFTVNNDTTNYPLKLNINIRTKKLSSSVVFDDDVVYDLNSIIPKGLISTDAKGEYRLINGGAYVLNKDNSIVRYTLDRPNETFAVTSVDVDGGLFPYLNNDSKIFNLRSGGVLLVSRVGIQIAFISLRYLNNKLTIDTRKNIITYPCVDVHHNIANTATITLDDSAVYISTIDDNDLNFLKYDLYKNTITKLENRDKLTVYNYDPSTMVLIANGLDTIFSVGGNSDDDLYYEYNIKTKTWIARGIMDISMDGFIPDAILLQNRSVLFTNNDPDGLYVLEVDNIGKLVLVPATEVLNGYKLSFIDDTGVLYMLNYNDNKIFNIRSHKQ